MNQGNLPRSWINFHHKENEMEDKKRKTISKEEGWYPEKTRKKLNWGNGRRRRCWKKMLEKNKKGGWIYKMEEKEKLGWQKQVWLNKKEEERRGSAKNRHWTEETKTRRCWKRIVWRSREVTKQQRFRSAQVNQTLPFRPTFLLPFNWLIYHVPRLQMQHRYLSDYEKLYYEVYYAQLQLTGILCAQCHGC